MPENEQCADGVDPLGHADLGETVTVTESKRLHGINMTPDAFFGSDRFADYAITDVEVVEAEDGDGQDILVTWEGDVTKRLTRRWDYHAEPITRAEEREATRKKWLKRAGKAVALGAPVALSTAIGVGLTNRLAGRLTINGETMHALSLPSAVVTVFMLTFIAMALPYLPGAVMDRGGRHV